jgi:spermidine synthase
VISSRPPYYSLILLSASALSYEILLMRLFSIIQWHHFAYLVIGLALLGYGISGSLLMLRQTTLIRHYEWLYPIAILLFAVGTLWGFLTAQSITFNIEELFWNPRQAVNLALVFLILALPFTLAASAICMTFIHFETNQVSKIYAADLVGAGLGSIAVLITMYYLMPIQILFVICLTGIVASALATHETKPRKPKILYISIISIIFALLFAQPEIELKFSPYKELTQALQIKGAKIIDQRASPLGHLTLVENGEVPFRHAPGLSLTNTLHPPEQLGLFIDADNLSAITRYPENTNSLSYLDQTTSALAYHLKSPSEILIIGSGTGADLLQAQYHRAPSIEALEMNSQIVDLINNEYADYAGPLYRNPFTQLHVKEARDFLVESDKQYDLIQIGLTDGSTASSSGLYALNENYLYTLEAIQLYLQHLKPGGYLSITRWIKLPPRDGLKLFATAYLALDSIQSTDVNKHILMIRNWQTSTLLVKNGRFTTKEINKAAKFCQDRLFDQAYHHQLKPEQSNLYNHLNEPTFYQVAQQITSGEIADLLESYKFNLEPATDDRPYFHHYFKWQSFIEALKLRHSGGMPLIEWGYIVLLLSLGITILFSAVLILLPLLFLPTRPIQSNLLKRKSPILFYFFLIGVAFLFIEIAIIQKFQLFLHHPIYSITASLTAFLCFSGVGSYLSERVIYNQTKQQLLNKAIFTLCTISLGYLILLPIIFDSLAQISVAMKLLTSILLIAPLAVCMGMPFPLAITSLKQNHSELIPWAWGINGYASVISAGSATIIAIQFGFTALLMFAVLLYIIALTTFPGREDNRYNKTNTPA